ncbi:MAG TPA: 2'-5' RNA ligase family protein [Patescibacteria group bacterium]|nr:2'-5' RNA ligase family protein [Patescibacteria group bacterium]
MHAYLIILEVSPLKIGSTYDMLPLHCTLVLWFWLKQEPEEVVEKLEASLKDSIAVVLKAGAEQVFAGKNKHGELVPVTVNDIELTPELRKLHEQVCAVLKSMDVHYSAPQYVQDGFHPHVTHQKDGQLLPGEVRKSTKLYLVEAAAPEYGNDRTVRASIELG